MITERYHIAKKTGSIAGEFWEGLKEALDQFESSGRTKTPPPTRQPTSPPPVRPTRIEGQSQLRQHRPKNEEVAEVKGKDRMKAEVEEEEEKGEEEKEDEEEEEKEEEKEPQRRRHRPKNERAVGC